MRLGSLITLEQSSQWDIINDMCLNFPLVFKGKYMVFVFIYHFICLLEADNL